MNIAGQVIQQIRRMPQPVVAAINGPAAGGGMNLALACDMRIASDKAVFSESFVKIGLIPDWGGLDFLSKLVGTAKAMELMMLGDRIDTAEAQRLGLVNQVVTHESFWDAVKNLAGATVASDYRGMAEALVAMGATKGRVDEEALAKDIADVVASALIKQYY